MPWVAVARSKLFQICTLCQKIAPKSVPHVQHDYFPSFNQSYHWFVRVVVAVAVAVPVPVVVFKFPDGRVLGTFRARSIQPKSPEISVQNSMDRFGPTGKVSKKRVHLWGGPLFPVGPVGILVEWIAPLDSRTRTRTTSRFDGPFLAKILRTFITQTIDLSLC